MDNSNNIGSLFRFFEIQGNNISTNGNAAHGFYYNDPGNTDYRLLEDPVISGNNITVSGLNSDGVRLYRGGSMTDGATLPAGIKKPTIWNNNITVQSNGANINLKNVGNANIGKNALNNNSGTEYKMRISGNSPLSYVMSTSTDNTHQGSASLCAGNTANGSKIHFTDGSSCPA